MEGQWGDPSLVGTNTWDVTYGYNAFGQVTGTKYPDPSNMTGQTYTVGYDAMQRPNYLTDSRGTVVVAGVAFNAADQPFSTAFNRPNGGGLMWEGRGYNQMNQLTAINGYTTAAAPNGTGLNVTYNCSPTQTQNNGQIASMTDNVVGQTVSYSYDALKRLTAATGVGSNAWTQSYTYDGFGNMTAKTESGTVFYGQCKCKQSADLGKFLLRPERKHDKRPEWRRLPNPNYAYDFANRLIFAKVSGGAETYLYGADNKRISTITSYSSGAFPAQANDSGSWNKYLYTRGDPVNRMDSAGTCDDEDGCSIGELEAGELGVEFEGGAEGNSITVTEDVDTTDPVFTATDICGQACSAGTGTNNAGDYTPLTGQPPNSFYIDPQDEGPVMRLFNQLGNWLLDIHWQLNHPEVGNPHLHQPKPVWGPKGPRFGSPETPISTPPEPVIPPWTTQEAPYSPWPRQPTPIVPLAGVGISIPFLPIIILNPCMLHSQLPSCKAGIGGT